MTREQMSAVLDVMESQRLAAAVGIKHSEEGVHGKPDYDVFIAPNQVVNVNELVDELRLLGFSLWYGPVKDQGERWMIKPPDPKLPEAEEVETCSCPLGRCALYGHVQSDGRGFCRETGTDLRTVFAGPVRTAFGTTTGSGY